MALAIMTGRRRAAGVVVCMAITAALVQLCIQVGTAAGAKAKVCPENTFSMVSTNGKHLHCICPDQYICKGCSYGCHVAMKQRCVRGFKPGCTTCSCKQVGLQKTLPLFVKQVQKMLRPRLGDLVDKIDRPFCQKEGRALDESKRYKGNATFVFVVSNGHTGTTFFGQLMTWRRAFRKPPPELVIAHEWEANKTLVQQQPFYSDYCDRALDYVAEQKLPEMLSALKTLNANTYFAAGHQIILGMLPALADVLGNRVKFVRLRRNRLDTAFSYMRKSAGPCQLQCKFCPCPLDKPVRCPVPSGHMWNSLNPFQQYLWAVDEVECKWQSLLGSRPHLKTMEINWSDAIKPETLRELAAFLGFPELELQADTTQKSNEHISNNERRNKDRELLRTWAAEYETKLHLPNCNQFTCIANAHDTQLRFTSHANGSSEM